jgi:hypothetical protein
MKLQAYNMMMSLSKSQDDDIMMMCLSKSQDKQVLQSRVKEGVAPNCGSSVVRGTGQSIVPKSSFGS